MQNGGLKLLYKNSDKILHNIGFIINRGDNLHNLLTTPIPMGIGCVDTDLDKYTSTRIYKRVINEIQNQEQNCIPVMIHTLYPKSQPLCIYAQPEPNITYNYILLELLLKRLFVDLEDAESKLLTNTLNQFKKVYLIDVGNIGVKLRDIFNFLIVRCDRETK
jgi:hypothetical protein